MYPPNTWVLRGRIDDDSLIREITEYNLSRIVLFYISFSSSTLPSLHGIDCPLIVMMGLAHSHVRKPIIAPKAHV